jgi:hypothetical protein
LILAVFALLLIEAGLVVFVFVSPSANERLEDVAADVQRAWAGTEDEPGFRTRAAARSQRVYDDWIAPLYRTLEVPAVDPEFTECVGCHPDYASQRRFNVYMNHPLHAEIGLECVACHPTNPHPNPPLPREDVCAECHSEVDEKEECGYCHPPASLPHFYYLGSPKHSVVNCDVCHPKNSFTGQNPTPKVDLGDFSGAERETCLSCHAEASCAMCHTPPHPADWVATHGPSLVLESTAQCYTCHTATWCSDRCHAVTPTSPINPRSIPPVGVRP